MTARVGVCIPAFNGASYIADAINSVLAQSFLDYHLWIVDNCSTDETLDVVRRVGGSQATTVCNPHNLGMIANWNRCIEIADAELVLLLHQDDVLSKTLLADVVALFDQNAELGIVSTGGRPINSNGKVNTSIRMSNARYRSRASTPQVMKAGRESIVHLMEYGVAISGVVVRRSAYEDVGTFSQEFPYSADEEMWTRVASKYSLGLLPGTVVYQRTHVTQFRNETWKRPDFLEQYFSLQKRRLSYLNPEHEHPPADDSYPRRLVAQAGSRVALRLIASGDFSDARRFLDSTEALYPAIAGDPKHLIGRLFCRVPRLGQRVCRLMIGLP